MDGGMEQQHHRERQQEWPPGRRARPRSCRASGSRRRPDRPAPAWRSRTGTAPWADDGNAGGAGCEQIDVPDRIEARPAERRRASVRRSARPAQSCAASWKVMTPRTPAGTRPKRVGRRSRGSIARAPLRRGWDRAAAVRGGPGQRRRRSRPVAARQASAALGEDRAFALERAGEQPAPRPSRRTRRAVQGEVDRRRGPPRRAGRAGPRARPCSDRRSRARPGTRSRRGSPRAMIAGDSVAGRVGSSAGSSTCAVIASGAAQQAANGSQSVAGQRPARGRDHRQARWLSTPRPAMPGRCLITGRRRRRGSPRSCACAEQRHDSGSAASARSPIASVRSGSARSSTGRSRPRCRRTRSAAIRRACSHAAARPAVGSRSASRRAGGGRPWRPVRRHEARDPAAFLVDQDRRVRATDRVRAGRRPAAAADPARAQLRPNRMKPQRIAGAWNRRRSSAPSEGPGDADDRRRERPRLLSADDEAAGITLLSSSHRLLPPACCAGERADLDPIEDAVRGVRPLEERLHSAQHRPRSAHEQVPGAARIGLAPGPRPAGPGAGRRRQPARCAGRRLGSAIGPADRRVAPASVPSAAGAAARLATAGSPSSRRRVPRSAPTSRSASDGPPPRPARGSAIWSTCPRLPPARRARCRPASAPGRGLAAAARRRRGRGAPDRAVTSASRRSSAASASAEAARSAGSAARAIGRPPPQVAAPSARRAARTGGQGPGAAARCSRPPCRTGGEQRLLGQRQQPLRLVARAGIAPQRPTAPLLRASSLLPPGRAAA